MSKAGYLLDTNVVSEGRRKRPDPRVVAFLEMISEEDSFLSVLTIGELRKGAALRGRSDRRGGKGLTAWIDTVEATFGDRILPVDVHAARIWGELSAIRPRSAVDTLIAATAVVHDLTLVTRNVQDMADTGVTMVNPWSPAP